MTNTDRKKTIVYVGAFNLNDFNASAIRAINIARCFEKLGYKTIICGYSECNCFTKLFSESIKLVNFKRDNSFKDFFDFSTNITNLIDFVKGCKAVICYNFPFIASFKIRRLCKKNGSLFLCDCTEWYSPKDNNIIVRSFKIIDSTLRMRVMNKINDGLIVISKRLFSLYNSNSKNVILIPPLNDAKVEIPVKEMSKEKIEFSYCGFTDKTKDDLDLIVRTFDEICMQYDNVFLTIIGTRKDEINYSPLSTNITFFGNVPHDRALELLSKSNCTILIRKNNRRNDYGFPTKFSESLSLGVPIISNNFSDIKDFIEGNGYLINTKTFKDELVDIINHNKLKKIKIINNHLSYKHYINVFNHFFSSMEVDND